ncbi:MAG: UvrD-helicase domain-containing protein [Lachnospiraceae bacterium]|nr:UvrD-helicase domain-containing protein [Lachnospiraceae bacterium]
MTDLLAGLNDKQKEAVQYTEGPLLILAGAGSGKTRVLTHRVGYLIERGLAEPWQILAITFTNKAAGEMRDRVDTLLPGNGQDVFVSTFHSMCVRMLRRDIDRLGYDRDFTIYDTDDQKTLMRGILKDLKMDPKQYRERGVLSIISASKNEMVDADDYEQGASDFYEKNIAKLYKEYEKRLRKNNALDFDDLLIKTVELFDEYPEVLENWQRRFRYIMVDEYQDTNTVQFEIVRLLSGKYRNLCVVGDDDQSIYKFRGANIENILSFEKSFPGSKVIKLEQNYRSTKSILHAANEVIKNNHERKAKTLWTENEEGTLPTFTEYETASEEADRVTDAVMRSVYRRCEQAVLYRTNAQSRLFEEKCIAKSIPYVIVGGVNFYQRKEIKDILSYLRIIANGVDDLAVGRVINVPKRGIGDTTFQKVIDFAMLEGISLYDALCRADEITGLNKGTLAKLNGFTDLIEGFRSKVLNDNVSLKELIESVRDDTGYAEELAKDDPVETESRLQNIEELISKASDFEEEDSENSEHEENETGLTSLARFLEDVSLVADIDRTDDTGDVLTMMTLHGAKGLEFEKVYLCGMEEGLFPSYASINVDSPDEEIEEERRLCYVGMTRAKKELCMSSAQTRMTNGETHSSHPSRFVDELPRDGVEIHRKKKKQASWEDLDDDYDNPIPRRGFNKPQSFAAEFGGFGSGGSKSVNISRGFGSLDTTPSGKKKSAYMGAFVKGSEMVKEKPDYVVGDRVVSVKFGQGTVKEILDTERDYQITVDFDKFGTKKLLAAFAKLKKV